MRRHLFVFAMLLLGLVAVAASASASGTPTPDPPNDDDEQAAPAEHAPVTMKLGLKVLELGKLELAAETFQAEFFVTVTCDHEPCKPNLDVANGKLLGKIEKLKDDPLYKEYKLKAELGALLDFSEYPYDSHALQIVIEDKGDPEQIKYVVDHEHTGVGDKGRFKLPGWELSQELLGVPVETEAPDGKKVQQVHFYIEAKRPMLMATFKSIVPVLIMMFVAAFTLLLKPKSAAGRLTAATAGLSAVVMFQVAQVGALPPLGYLTRLDKFMIGTYLVYLANIAFSVAMVRFEEKKNERMSELMYLSAAGAVPGIALLVWTAVLMRLV
jgi:hypothetical protein